MTLHTGPTSFLFLYHVLGALCLLTAVAARAAGQSATPAVGTVGMICVRGQVIDSASEQPLPGAVVQIFHEQQLRQAATTTALGRFSLSGVPQERYDLLVRRIGFRPVTLHLDPAASGAPVTIRMTAAATALDELAVTALQSPSTIDDRTGNQVFQQDSYHGSPATTTSEIVQQSIAGAARAPAGEVHIRGQHGEFTYYVDGMPVQPGISGSLSELFAPAVVDRIEFQTGGWDAEFGNRNTAVIKVDTKIPAGGLRLLGSVHAGSFNTVGQSLVASTNIGKLGILISGAQQSTDIRRDPTMQDTVTGAPLNFQNHGLDRYAFAKLRYTARANDLLTLDVSISRAGFEIPYDSTGGFRLNDRQQERNGFANLSWRHALGSTTEGGELFVGLSHRGSGLRYIPGIDDRPLFLFYPDTTRFNVRENRSATTNGLKVDLTFPAWGAVQLRTGTEATLVRGREDFSTFDVNGVAGPAVDAAVRGGDVGGYVQAIVRIASWWEVRPGVRYDVHVAPISGTTRQISPRIRMNLHPTATTSAWLYYGRQFVPSPVEDFKVLAEAGQNGQSGLPTFPERDNFYEAGIVQRLPSAGVSLKLTAYHKQSAPAIDDNTLPGTALTATVNVAQVRVTGIESVIDVRPGGPLSGFLNVALSHAYAHGPVTGGFSPTLFPTTFYDLDHDQRLSATGNISYDRGRWFVSATGLYGSGLTSGNPAGGTNGLGLFDFNVGVKVAPSFIVNVGGGVTVRALGRTFRPQLFIDNALNHYYVLKGAFTSGKSIGRPRTLLMRLDVGF